jgi:DNA-binding response OmpR family regulator
VTRQPKYCPLWENMPPHNLLLFEDFEDNICAALAPGFQKAGFQTHLVTSVEDCFKFVRIESPEVVLMITNNIRGTSPFAVADTIRDLHPKCGFLFLAGSEEDGRERFFAAGYKFQVRSIPMSGRELIAAISAAIASPLETFVTPDRGELSG